MGSGSTLEACSRRCAIHIHVYLLTSILHNTDLLEMGEIIVKWQWKSLTTFTETFTCYVIDFIHLLYEVLCRILLLIACTSSAKNDLHPLVEAVDSHKFLLLFCSVLYHCCCMCQWNHCWWYWFQGDISCGEMKIVSCLGIM